MTPSAVLLSFTGPADSEFLMGPLDVIEYAGRVDYGDKSLAKMGEQGIIGRWIAMGHESMLEMVDATFLITCSRVVSHELVRHRMASYQQESQRYVAYDDEDSDDLFYIPTEFLGNEEVEREYEMAYLNSLASYLRLKEMGVPKQYARYVMPNATRTRIVVKANLREWRHILRLRLHTSAQPEMREVMKQVLERLQREFGKVMFPDDIAEERGVR